MRNKLFAGALALALTCTTVFSSVAPATVKAASVSTVQTQDATDDYVYCYAGLSWAEYWNSEGVYNADNTTSSDVLDQHEEYDKGGFDTVTRASVNHGLHRGSFQCSATIKGKSGAEYKVSYWTDKNTAVLTDGSTITFNSGSISGEKDGTPFTDTMTEYDVLGLKYVPVAVKSSDMDEFSKKYTVVKNNSTLEGGFTENNLKNYTGLVADVTADTNGLKVVTKNSDGSFSFGSRTSGKNSGIKDQNLKTANLSELGPKVEDATSEFGESIRVDFTKNYGDLGANMQAVKWTYYGNDSTRTNAVRTFGTKFAADNWMHKNMGIQLGLTESYRFALPENYDGTGYWSLTIYALGYEDSSYDFVIKPHNIANRVNSDKLSELIDNGNALKANEENYSAATWKNFDEQLTKASDELNNDDRDQNSVDAAYTALKEATDALVDVTSLKATITKTASLNKADYTSDSWNSLETSLTSAKSAVSDATTAQEVENADKALNAAISSLVKKPATNPAESTTGNKNDTSATTTQKKNNTAATTTQKKNNTTATTQKKNNTAATTQKKNNTTTQKKNNTKPATTQKKKATKPALKKANVKLSKPSLKVGKTTKNKAKLTWKKVKKATGYEIQYTTKNFGNKKATKTIKVSKAKVTSAQLKKLKKKTKYKVRIRAVYTKAGYKTVTSKWSATKTVKTK